MSRVSNFGSAVNTIVRQKNFKQTLRNHGEIRKEPAFALTPTLQKVCPFKPNEPCFCGSRIKFKKCHGKRT